MPVEASDYWVPVLAAGLAQESVMASEGSFESSVAVSCLFEQSTDCALWVK